MSSFPALPHTISDVSPTSYAPSMGDGLLQEALKRARISDMDSALAALADAEKMIEAQRRKIAYLETLALNDDVTGLMNRRGFMAALQRDLCAAKRDPQAHGMVIMFDLDNFKTVNDTYGHAAGDAYLSGFAAALTAEVRGSDIVARFGGDEFAMLISRIASKPGMARSQTIISNINAKSVTWRDVTLPLRSSMGTATFGGRDIAEAVMVSADLKLYAHKQKRKEGAK